MDTDSIFIFDEDIINDDIVKIPIAPIDKFMKFRKNKTEIFKLEPKKIIYGFLNKITT